MLLFKFLTGKQFAEKFIPLSSYFINEDAIFETMATKIIEGFPNSLVLHNALEKIEKTNLA